jgi:hypothetical protein
MNIFYSMSADHNVYKLASGEEQGPTRWEVALLSKIKTLKIHRN